MRATKTHKCENSTCENTAAKDRYGNYRRYCCDECKKQSTPAKIKSTYADKDMDVILAKRKATVTERYGVDNVSKTTEVREKLKVTTKASAGKRLKKTKENNLEKYGVESTNSLQSVKDKKKQTFQEKYGVDHQLQIPEVAASVSQKNSDNAKDRLATAAQTKLEVYGDQHYNNRNRYRETCIERFGIGNPSQNAEVHERKMKSQYRNKEFVFPSGRAVMVMGYEPKALAELLLTYHENDIITETTKIPTFTYHEKDGSAHVYFPDIYIPKDNLIIEVKSEYTYRGFIGWYETNKLKEQAVVDAGYTYKLMIMAKK